MKTYRLFIGFRKLGEFSCIREAKLFARDCGLAGAFNLVGNNYRDSWYVFESEIKSGVEFLTLSTQLVKG